MKYSQVVDGAKHVQLKKCEAGWTAHLNEKTGEERLGSLGEKIARLQTLLYAASTHGVLVVLQGMDASGKDGTIRKAFQFLNPLGCTAFAFKAPTEEEAKHDFLWRVHHRAPGHGQIHIFNRSHYEDILFPYVHKKLSLSAIEERLEHINQFESLMHHSNIIVLKFFLHISKNEQEKRLVKRKEDPLAAWKVNPGDWEDRQLWKRFEKCYEMIFSNTSTKHAPWHIVPADNKWFRNIAVAEAFVKTLEGYEQEWRNQLAAKQKTFR